MIKKILITFFILTNFLLANENLYFVGENLNIISVISDRPELPNRTPAEVKIIDKNSDTFKINSNVNQILNDLPGFYIEPIKGIDRLYFRGIKNSLLFLFDGVPITSEATKNLIPSDYTVNKELLSKMEIVYGASSVFWGPDAFGGVVNLVPDELEKDETELKVISGSKNNGFTLKKSFSLKNFLYGTIGFSYLNRNNDYSNNFIESYGKFHLFENFNLTYHISSYNNNYKTKYDKLYSWKSSYKYPFNLIKGEYFKQFKHTSIKFKGYFLDLKSRYKEDYFHWKQHSNTFFYEFRLNRDLFNNNGLLTIGASYKKTKVFNSDVVIRGFIPDYIVNKNSLFTPLADEVSFNSYLKSFYAQYVHNIKNFEIWSGLRYDDHSKYSNVTNWNIGFGGFFNNYFFKLNYATAYRTPIAEKFLSRKDIEPEKIKMISLSNSFKFKNIYFNFTTFWQKIKHRIFEDNYGGFSVEGENRIYGIESSLKINFKKLKFWSNFTALKETGDDEDYKILKYILIIPGESPEYVYDFKERKFDYGAKYFGLTGISYRFKDLKFYLKCNFYKHRNYYYLHNQEKFHKNFIYNLNFATEYKINSKLNVFLKINNLLTNDRELPGNYYRENSENTKFQFDFKYLF